MVNIYNQKNSNNENPIGGIEVPQKPIHADFAKYEDPTGDFTTGQFKWGLWYTKHKVLLYQIFKISLIVWIVIFWSYALFNFGNYLIFGFSADTKLRTELASFPNYTPIQPKYAPAPLRVEGVNALAGGTDSYDLVAQTTNPNKNFVAYLDYYFVANGENTPVQHSLLLAGETRPLVYFGLKGTYPGGINIVFKNISWQRISTHDVEDPLAWQNEHLNFVVSDFSFTAQGASVDGVNANVLKFNLRNDSPYGYRDGEFVVGLMQGEGLAAVMPLYLKDFKSGETRAVDLRNFVSSLPVSDVRLFPMIDIYDKTEYLAPER